MYRRARMVLVAVVLVILPRLATAQVTWQPTRAPLVTAENETWYRAGAAIEWNGDFYYPAGAPEAFNAYQMVRAGSYRGIPLYTDTMLEPYSIVFVPIAGGRMQPYERPRTGVLAGSVGSRAPLLPTETPGALAVTPEGFVAQAPAPPTYARAYDLAPAAEPQPITPAVPIVGTTGSVAAPARRVTGTTGRGTVATGVTTMVRPKGINSAWLDYDGRRWISAGRAVDLDSDFARVGTYKGSPVYQRTGDRLTIYIPTSRTVLAPFKPASL